MKDATPLPSMPEPEPFPAEKPFPRIPAIILRISPCSHSLSGVYSSDSATLGKITTDKVRAVELVRNAEPRKVEKPQGLTGRGPTKGWEGTRSVVIWNRRRKGYSIQPVT